MTTYRIALIGAGYMASEHARAITATPGLKLAGILSRSRMRAEQLAGQHGIEAICESVDDLYATTRADAVLIATSEIATRAIVECAFRYPWAALIEKPVGYNLGEAEQIHQSAVEHGARAFAAFNRRFFSSVTSASGALSEIAGPRTVIVQDQQSRTDGELLGRPAPIVKYWMFANSIHTVDLVRYFCRGTLKRVETPLPWREEAPPIVHALAYFDSGDIGIYTAIWRGPGPWSVQISTPELRIELRPLEQEFRQKVGERVVNPIEADPIDRTFKPGLKRMAENLLKMLEGDAHSLTSLSDSLDSMRLLGRIYGVEDQ